MHTYFAATLPMLFFDGPQPFPLAVFAKDCERLLSHREARDARIALGLEQGEAANALLRAWQQYEEALKNEAAWVRAGRLHRDPAKALRGKRAFAADIGAAVAQAARTDNPLESERVLLRLQWDKLEGLTLNSGLSIEFILAYAVRLRLLQRLNAFKSSEGAKELEELLESATQGWTATEE